MRIHIQATVVAALASALCLPAAARAAAVVGQPAPDFSAKDTSGATQSLTQVPLLPRLCNAALSYLRYLAKVFWPQNLAVYYPTRSAFHPGCRWPPSRCSRA